MPSQIQYEVFHPDATSIMHPYTFEREELAKVGAQLILAQCRTEEEVIEGARDADVLLQTSINVTERIIASMPRCKLIVRYGIGLDKIDVSAATKHGIVVANTPTYCIEEVSTQTVALLLACARKLPLLDRAVRQQWSNEHTLEIVRPIYRLRYRTLGLIGFGKIARAVARKVQGFQLDVIVYDPYISPREAQERGARLVPLETLLQESDYVSIHVPLTDETRHMLQGAQFKLMKKSAFLINTGRGAVVDEQSLYEALAEGWIAGAGLDVLEHEPPQENNPLLQLNNVIFGHHLGSYSEESWLDTRRQVCEAIVHTLTGKWPAATVNREVIPRVTLV